jgi:hypothetical protein
MDLFDERSSVKPHLLLQSCEESGVEQSLDGLQNRHGYAVQLGSVGALVMLGVLGGAGEVRAAVRRGQQCEALDPLQSALGDRPIIHGDGSGDPTF